MTFYTVSACYDNQNFSETLIGLATNEHVCDQIKLEYCKQRFGDSISEALGQLECGYYFEVAKITHEHYDQMLLLKKEWETLETLDGSFSDYIIIDPCDGENDYLCDKQKDIVKKIASILEISSSEDSQDS